MCHCQGNADTKRQWTQLGLDPQSFCSSTLSPAPTPDRVVTVVEHRKSPGSHVALSLAPPSQTLQLAKVVAASTVQGKMQAVLTSDLALPPKTLGTQIAQGCSHTNTPSRLGKVTVSSNFIET